MKYKQVLVVKEIPPPAESDIKQTSEHQITTWCCCDQGSCKVDVKFERNTFFPNEICRAQADVDNTQCNLGVHDVRLAVEQDLEIDAGGHRFRETYTLTEQHA